MNRFWSKVDTTGDCWLWTASIGTAGYGQFSVDGNIVGAHRVVWELEVGEIPEGMCVLHHCDTPLCVNPGHLFLGTSKDNTTDMLKKGRENPPYRGVTHCHRGHRFSGENVRGEARGKRVCKACERIRGAAYRLRKRSRGESHATYR